MGFALSDIQLSSPAFSQGGAIPAKHTGEGVDVSPALSWEHVPEGTKAFAVMCHDPDAPLVKPDGNYGYVHWVLYNIPADVTSLAEDDDRFTSGVNDFGNPGYGGPMPPNGHGTHYYFYWILALNDATPIEEGLGMHQFLAHIEPRLIGMNRLVGTYQRD